MLKSIEEVYYITDEIVQLKVQNNPRIGRRNKLSTSEIITILIEGHRRGYSTEKQLYGLTAIELKGCFSRIPSYAQFTRAIRKSLPMLDFILEVFTQINARKEQDFCIVDSTALPVAGYNKYHVKWALDSAGIGKNMHGFYQGFKLHIIINQDREIVSIEATKANVHDVQLLKSPAFVQNVKSRLIGDKGYIMSSKDRDILLKKGVILIAKQRENMDPYLNEYYKTDLQKRKQIESIFGYLKTRVSMLFPFMRTAESFLVQVKSAVLTYMLRTFDSNSLSI